MDQVTICAIRIHLQLWYIELYVHIIEKKKFLFLQQNNDISIQEVILQKVYSKLMHMTGYQKM